MVALSSVVALRAVTAPGESAGSTAVGGQVIARCATGSEDGLCVATLNVLDSGGGSVVLGLSAFQVDEFGLPEIEQSYEFVSGDAADPIRMQLGERLVTARLARGTWGSASDASMVLAVQ